MPCLDSLSSVSAFVSSTPLEPQSRFGGKLLEIGLVCPQNGTAVLKGLMWFNVVIGQVCPPCAPHTAPLLIPAPAGLVHSQTLLLYIILQVGAWY